MATETESRAAEQHSDSNESPSNCQFKGCDRPQYASKTTPMSRADKGESYPDDVEDRPICFRHWAVFEVILDEAVPYIMAGLMMLVLWWFEYPTWVVIAPGAAFLLAGVAARE